jgi:hypothetical protein
MEALATVSLVGTVVQLVDFSSKLVSTTTELYRSGRGALGENIDIETAAADLCGLQLQIKKSVSGCGSELQDLCQACDNIARELLDALSKIKVQANGQKWMSFRKAFRSIWSKEEIHQLENRLISLRIELNLRISVETR